MAGAMLRPFSHVAQQQQFWLISAARYWYETNGHSIGWGGERL
jgi:hypothetical protein